MCVKKAAQSWDRALLEMHRELYHLKKTYWNDMESTAHPLPLATKTSFTE
jgi:hypothetical protein